MGHILDDWDLDEKLTLLAKVHQALPDDGVLIVFDHTGAALPTPDARSPLPDHPRRAPVPTRLDGRRIK